MSVPAVGQEVAEAGTVATAKRTSGVISNLGALGIAQITTSTLTLIWTLIVPRHLGPAGTGLIVLVWSANGLLMTFCEMGSRTMLVREIARDATKAPQLLGTAMVVRAVSTVPAVGLVLLYIKLGRFHWPEDYVLYLSGALTVLMLIAEPLEAAFQGIERMRYLAYGSIINKALISLLGVALVLLGFRALTLVWLLVGAAAVVLVLDWFWLRPLVTIDWRRSLQGMSRFLRLSVSFWAYTVFHSVYLWGDSAMIGVLAPTAVLGYYGVSSRLFGTLLILATMMSTAWLPRLSAAHLQGSERLKETARAPLTLALVLSLPMAAGAALIAEPLLTMLYGPAFLPAVPVLMILAAVAIPMYLNIVISSVLIAAGRQNLCTAILSGGALLNVVTNVLLIRHFQSQFHNGAIGAALALLTTEVCMAAVSLVVARRYVSRQILPRAARSLLATAVMAVAVLLVHRFSLFVQVGTGLVSFATVAAVVGLATKEEREQAKAFARRAVRQVLNRDRSGEPAGL